MKRVLLSLLLLGLAPGLRAEPRAAVELIEPRGGAVLEGGRQATLVWSAASLPDRVEEWEAFLSVDDGGYYAVRITPHLDAGTRSFRWRVPNVAASRARILIRVGDERDERTIELPQTFRIVPRLGALQLPALHAAATESAGEASHPHGPPVVEWVSGDRRGAGLVTHRQRDRASLDGDSVLVVLEHAPATGSDPPRHARPAAVRAARPFPIASTQAAPAFRPPLRPILLLTTRLNV